MRQGRRIKQPSAVSQTLTKTLITLAILAAIAGLGVWFVTTRDSAPPPLSAADKAAGIHGLPTSRRLRCRPRRHHDRLNGRQCLGHQHRLQRTGHHRPHHPGPGKTSVRLTEEGESANPLDLKLRLVNVRTSGAGAPYADVQITR